MTTPTVEEIATIFRVQFDELGLKAPKGKSMPGLERELIVDYWCKALTTYGNARYDEGVKEERERILKMVKRHYPSDWAVEQGKKEGKDRYALGGKTYLDLIVNALTPNTP